jgi:hypothetical protein
MKKKISIVLVCGFYFVLHIATSKKQNILPNPCQSSINTYIGKDTALYRRAQFGLVNATTGKDTLYLLVSDSTLVRNYQVIADSLCYYKKLNCSINATYTIIANTQSATASWNTRFGKIIVSKDCP